MGPVTINMILVGLLVTVVSAVTIQDKAVTPHWENICGTSLLFSEEAKTWDDAQGFCELLGGNLVDIRSMEMNYCILNHAYHKALPQTNYWHSGNDLDVEGVYRYNRHGDFMNWTPIWYGAEDPNGGKYANCLDVHLTTDTQAGKWGDSDCNSAFRYICQRKLQCRENTDKHS